MHQFKLNLRVCLAAIVFCRMVMGQVVYSDGATHSIPGDPGFSNGQWIGLQNASGLNVNAGAVVGGGAGGTSNGNITGVSGISGLAGTSIQHTSGTVTGIGATSVADNFSPGSISATGGSGINTAGSYLGSGGTVNGATASADGLYLSGLAVVPDIVEAYGGAGVTLGAGAAATFSGATINGGEAFGINAKVQSRGFGGPAVRLNSSGPVNVVSGTFTGGTGNGESQFFDIGSGLGHGGATFEVNGSSSLTIQNGTFYGGIGAGIIYFDNDETVTAIGAAALKITGASNVTVNGGSFSAGSTATGVIPPAVPVSFDEGAILVTGDITSGDLLLNINNGTFGGQYGLSTIGTRPNSANSQINIFGGDLQGAAADLVLSNPDILTNIFGSNFLLDSVAVPYGLVTATSGTLAGTLSNGSPFEWQFTRNNDAPLLLVPEPASISFLVVGAMYLRRHRLRKNNGHVAN